MAAIMHRLFSILALAGCSLVLTRHLAVAEELPSLQWNVQLAGGALTIPQSNHWLGILDIATHFAYDRSSLCPEYTYQLFTSHLRLGFSTEDGLPLPYVSFSTQIFRWNLKPYLYIMIGKFRLERAILPSSLNLEHDATFPLFGAGASIQKQSSWFGIRCHVELETLGGKEVRFASGEIPFSGIFMAGLSPGCTLSVGPKRLQFQFEILGNTDLSVGKSGNGNPEIPGTSGALVSETSAQGALRLEWAWKRLEEVRFLVQADVRYLLLVDTGNRSLNQGIWVGLMAGVRFGKGTKNDW